MNNDNEIHQKHRGAHNELLAAVWLLSRGYEVFRNVSAHGPVDLIAMRNGEVFKIDVKSCDRFPRGTPQLTNEQRALGVKLLAVYPDGNCEIITSIPKPVPALGYAACKECGKKFKRAARRQMFCSEACSKTFHKMNSNRSPIAATLKDF